MGITGTRDEDALQRFVACRDAGDVDGATAAWAEVVEVMYDRVVTLVAIHGRREPGLNAEEQAEVVQRVLFTMWDRVRWTFAGVAMGQLVQTLKKVVSFRAADLIDEKVRQRKQDGASLDELRGDAGEGFAPAAAEVEEATWRWTRAEEQVGLSDWIDTGMAKLDDREREVVQDALAKVPAKVTAERLGVTMNNLYKLRERGLDRLAGYMKEMDA